jgi:hypothetical protein
LQWPSQSFAWTQAIDVLGVKAADGMELFNSLIGKEASSIFEEGLFISEGTP